ncbi:holo-ACP synthase, partial [Bacillus sp. D-CC]
LNRIEKMLDGKLKFMERILTESERNVAKELKGSRLTEFVAGRFAAKEAYSKAVGTGIGKEVSFLDKIRSINLSFPSSIFSIRFNS